MNENSNSVPTIESKENDSKKGFVLSDVFLSGLDILTLLKSTESED